MGQTGYIINAYPESVIKFFRKTLNSKLQKIKERIEKEKKEIGLNVAMGTIEDDNAVGFRQAIDLALEIINKKMTE